MGDRLERRDEFEYLSQFIKIIGVDEDDLVSRRSDMDSCDGEVFFGDRDNQSSALVTLVARERLSSETGYGVTRSLEAFAQLKMRGIGIEDHARDRIFGKASPLESGAIIDVRCIDDRGPLPAHE